MKIKRIIAAISAAVVMGTMTVTSFAVKDGEAAYCFDTASRVSDWQTYGSVSETGFKLKQSNKEAKNGDGSLLISEDVTGEVANHYGGAYITADTVGLSSFGGCTISMSVLLARNAENHHESLRLYSDGMIWLETSSDELNSKTWTEIVLEIPEDASNSTVGFTIPTYDVYTGDVLFIDDFSIVDASGKAVANMGDYKLKTFTSISAAPAWVNIVLIVVLVLLVGVIVGGIIMLVSQNVKKFH